MSQLTDENKNGFAPALSQLPYQQGTGTENERASLKHQHLLSIKKLFLLRTWQHI